MSELMTPSSDFFTTYEVDERRICHNVIGKPAKEIWESIVAKLDDEGRILLETLEYVSPSIHSYDPQCWNVIVFTVRGASEGFYLHIGQLREGVLEGLVLAKTLDGRPDRIKRLESMIWRIIDESC